MSTQNHRADPNGTARRVCAQQEIASHADTVHIAIEAYEPNDRDRACFLASHIGNVSGHAVQGTDGLRTELIRVAGHALDWIEQIDREAAW